MNRPATFSTVTRLLGRPVLDVKGTVVGHVTELLVDETDGRIAYVQFGFDRNRQGAQCKITVPWSSIRPDNQADAVWQLRVCRSTLEHLSEARQS